uniref:Uncharacterized protein n=1 Tax=Caenorhabditis japonica TaxID=281687 RepID=A0A8R1HZ33_CAEJA
MHWMEVNFLLLLHETNLYSIVFLSTLFIFSLVKCGQKESSDEETEKKNAPERQPPAGEVTASENFTSTATQKSQVSNVTQQKSQKSLGRKGVADSIKIIKGKKNAGKVRVLTASTMKNVKDNSQHTEIINIPLRKADNSDNGPNMMTRSAELKVNEKSPGKKIQFAEKLVRSSKK